MPARTVLLKPLDQLQLWDRNYRRGQVEAVKRSIERFGFNGALRVRNGVVYAGNHSLKALLELHAEGVEPPTGIQAKAGSWLVPIIELAHLTEAEAMAFAIADNHTQDLGYEDLASLRDLVSELLDQDETLVFDAGYDATAVEALLSSDIDDEKNRIADKSDVTDAAIHLKWAKNTVQITEDESAQLTAALDAHIEKHGTSFGFVRGLLGL